MRMIVESLGVFAVSIVVLLIIHIVLNINTGRAYGIGWLNYKGFVLIGVGVLYLALGAVLASLKVAIR